LIVSLCFPSCTSTGFTASIWPKEVYITPTHYYDSVATFYVVANVGLILFMFIMGMELDQGLIKAQWRQALPIAVGAIVFPFGVGVAVSPWLAVSGYILLT
jgi:Kef-type K+ transport system membrane component KefB